MVSKVISTTQAVILFKPGTAWVLLRPDVRKLHAELPALGQTLCSSDNFIPNMKFFYVIFFFFAHMTISNPYTHFFPLNILAM